MKGIVFTEFIEMVEQKFSTSIANRLLDETELASGGAYTAVGTYDHRELVSMVVRLSEISGLATPVLEREPYRGLAVLISDFDRLLRKMSAIWQTLPTSRFSGSTYGFARSVR